MQEWAHAAGVGGACR